VLWGDNVLWGDMQANATIYGEGPDTVQEPGTTWTGPLVPVAPEE
jgi:hypothetical protein